MSQKLLYITLFSSKIISYIDIKMKTCCIILDVMKSNDYAFDYCLFILLNLLLLYFGVFSILLLQLLLRNTLFWNFENILHKFSPRYVEMRQKNCFLVTFKPFDSIWNILTLCSSSQVSKPKIVRSLTLAPG